MDRIDSPEVRVVEASAGSGKTYCLAVRYLKLLINPSLKLEDIPLNGIAAITFSNKAALGNEGPDHPVPENAGPGQVLKS